MPGLDIRLFGGYLRLRSFPNGDDRFSVYRQMQREQWLDPQELEHMRLRWLSRMLAHACRQSTFYRRRLRGSVGAQAFPGSTDDPR